MLVPHVGHEVFTTDDPAGVRGQAGQEVELLGPELDLAATDEHPAGTEVDLEVADGHDVARSGGGAGAVGDGSEVGGDAGEELGEPEGFGDVVDGA